MLPLQAISIIKEFEGFRANAYPDPATGAEPITIGYGSTRYADGSKIKMGDVVSESHAESMLIHDLYKFKAEIDGLIKVNLNDNQLSAILSFVYNLGTTNFRNSTLLRLINKGDFAGAAGQFERWVFANGRRMNGLVRRRLSEKTLFEK